MIIYNYHPETKILIGADEADESPLEPGVYLIPAHATTIEPPEPLDGKYIVFLGNEWGYAEVPQTPPAPPVYVPPLPGEVTSVSARQFKLQLYYTGILEIVNGWAQTQPVPVQLAYEYSSTFVKNDPMMRQGFTDLGFTEEQMDDFFNAAALL
ncbi:tail fiber assembly like protein [Sinorhizobium phage phiM7]|uniref:Tail fiber assembly protein n=2 Tax=Emdodecavirus TaxID=1980937 RepID=S5MCW4_9CAUD|nr:hypothetical protein AB690_gp095 [Sinorhizobium phage phiM12]YP_009601212.1 tail fiber assembly like protein [Sinorhizobium phage phiM7]AGR47754.1 hypothetical protein SmphiM12_122 [Sinorhizobium phage phiM12]AKF12634.1 tail fiber assembly like protein [Sinorhizobium phage phiM7]AKF12994.1 hypothetical protein PHIM19_88 [Sinorhizobium phage phiM19]